jgi:hypothetical protein
MKLALARWTVAALLGTLAVGCGADAEEKVGAVGELVASPDDEALDANDPPTSPDPADPVVANLAALDDDGALGAVADSVTHPACAPRGALLSPKGLTFVLHFSKHAGEAQRELAHLKDVAGYLRGRDVFLVEHTSPILDRLARAFPCNSIQYIAYPDEIDTALATGGRIDGIAVDWEGGVISRGPSYSVDRLRAYAAAIRKKGKIPSVVPAWPAGFDDGDIANRSHMAYELAQIQGSCVAGPARFAANARGTLLSFREHAHAMRDIGFEISLDSVTSADNHVGPDRAADCTRAAFGKGARAIYIYGNGHDHLLDYFHRLGAMGVRAKR